MALDPPPSHPDADDPLRGGDKNVKQENIKNVGGNVTGVNKGTIIGNNSGNSNCP
jgi:hypothetical protein